MRIQVFVDQRIEFEIVRKRSVTTALYRSLGERTVSITSRDGHFGGVAER
jgi:hypothetical protein